MKLTPNNWPNMVHAGCYAGTLHFLKAVADMGAAKVKAATGTEVADRMKAMPTEDECFGKGSIRQDGRGMFNSYLFEVKKPSESKGKWDYYNLRGSSTPDQAWRSLQDGGCYFIKA